MHYYFAILTIRNKQQMETLLKSVMFWKDFSKKRLFLELYSKITTMGFCNLEIRIC